METHLDSLERKIEELLAKADEEERKMKEQTKHSGDKPAAPNGEGDNAT